MTFTDYLPIISTLIGGLLAVIGGFVSNYLLKSKDKESEKKEFYREQLEQIYLLSGETVDWVGSELSELLAMSQAGYEPKKDKKENPFSRLTMLVNLYHPFLKEHLVKMEQCIDNFNNGRGTFLLHVLEGKVQPPRAEVFKKNVDAPYIALREVRKQLASSVENMISKYI